MIRLIATIFITIALCPARSHAALVYDFRFEHDAYEAASGSTIDVSVIFRETATAGEELRFFSSELGLTGLGITGVTYQPNSPATSVLSVPNVSAIVINSLFSDAQFKNISNATFVTDIGGQRNSGIKIGSNAASHEILFGTISFSVVGNPGDTAVLGFSSGALGDVFFNNSIVETEPVTFGTATFEVTAVPEPASVVALAAIGGAALIRRTRRKHAHRGDVRPETAS